LLGAQKLGAHALDLTHELTHAISNSFKVEDITKTVYTHPTLSESVPEAVYGLQGGTLHQLKKE